jgi:hypothetical protein
MGGADSNSVGGGKGPSLPAHALSIHDDIFDDLNGTTWGSEGKQFQFVNGGTQQANTVTINHVTSTHQPGSPLLVSTCCNTSANFIFTNNIMEHGPSGIAGENTAEGTPTITGYFPGAIVSGNIIVGCCFGHPYPSGNFFPAAYTNVFLNFNGGNGGDYHVQSPFQAKGTDGKDVGADVDAVSSATLGAFPN